jgi:hypothetical protein
MMAKKRFECGHLGKGRYCHRCYQDRIDRQKQLEQEDALRQSKEEWKNEFLMDDIDLKTVGAPQQIVKKARWIIEEISNGISPFQLGGKKLKQCKGMIRIPVGRNYRLLCRECVSGYKLDSLLTHEQYNVHIGK